MRFWFWIEFSATHGLCRVIVGGRGRRAMLGALAELKAKMRTKGRSHKDQVKGSALSDARLI